MKLRSESKKNVYNLIFSQMNVKQKNKNSQNKL